MFNKKSNSLQNIIDEDNRPITYITKRKIMSTSDFEVAPTDYKIETSSFNLKHDEESPLKRA